ncbi:sulfotransferase 6B1-like [Aplysia californica]|uniref:Sulfotransferase 6B1-like n=1 Tax=Aplysia californica TaxID=6500 RepID=A0ABM1VW24_APLCA|nr:sulfotransferase 6B1-like [Aplysia californica]
MTMLRRGVPKLTDKTKAEAFVDICHPKMLDALPSPRILNSHLTFSDLPTQDLPREIKRIAKFLEIEVADDLIQSICQATAVDTMREAFKSFIVRKGQVGDWKNWLTEAQDEALDDVAKETMPGLSIYKPRFTLP